MALLKSMFPYSYGFINPGDFRCKGGWWDGDLATVSVRQICNLSFYSKKSARAFQHWGSPPCHHTAALLRTFLSTTKKSPSHPSGNEDVVGLLPLTPHACGASTYLHEGCFGAPAAGSEQGLSVGSGVSVGAAGH